YGPFVEMLGQWLGIDRDTPPVVSRVRLLSRLRESLGPDATVVLPYLSQLLGVEGITTGTKPPPLENAQRGEAIRRAYASWIAALAEERPVVIAVDEVERADTSTKLLLNELCRLTG